MKQEKISSFKHIFDVPTKDFRKTIGKELTVYTYIKDNHLQFVVTIPAYIFRKVFNTKRKYLDSYIQKNYLSPVLNKKVRFGNQLKSEVFHDLVGRFDEVCRDAMQVQSVIDSEKDKVILVKFNKDDVHEKDTLNHASKGRKLSTKFQYFVCYRRKTRDIFTHKTKYFYESLERDTMGLQDQIVGFGFKRYFDDVEKEFNVIPWTQEKEDFFKNIEKGFVTLNEKLDEFFGNLTDEKVQKLIATYKPSNLLPEYREEKNGKEK